MNYKTKTKNKHALHKLTVLSAAATLALMSGCSFKGSISKEVKAEGINPKANEQKASNSKSGENTPKPNVVYIMLDDSGYSDIGSYGSEIKTPNIDSLAENGLRYNNAHVTPLCSPTRAALLTGRNSHDVGMGMVANFDLGPEYPNKRGLIKPEAGTIAEVLGENNYNSYALGKWHLAPTHQTTAAGPYDYWPLSKGFDRYYGFLEDSSDQYLPELTMDNSPVDVPEKENYHFSEDIVDRANQYVTDHASMKPDDPFFLYLAFGAQHMPHQVPQKYIDAYKGVYDEGWDKIREDRFNRQKDLGIIPKDAQLPASNPGVKPWDELSDEEKRAFIRFQETYAGFMTHTDEQIGRFLDTLESTGQMENTMIVFLTDNGGSSKGAATGSVNQTLAYNGIKENFEDISKRVDDFGTGKVTLDYPSGWAQVSNTPFKLYKGTNHSGGVQTPLIIQYPKLIKDKGAIRDQFVFVNDITPTVYDVIGVELPKEIKGVKQMPLAGTSFAKTLTDPKAEGKKTQHFETASQRAIYHDGWKAIASHKPNEDFENDKWELYHKAEDFTEINDLTQENPKKLKELQQLWEKEAKKYGVFPMTFITSAAFLNIPEDSIRARNSYTLYPGMSRLTDSAAPPIQNRSYSITVPLERASSSDEGVLVAAGKAEGGYTLYIQNNKLVYEYNMGTDVYRIESNTAVPTGKVNIRFDFEKVKENNGIGKLYINDQQVGEGTIEKTHPFKVAFEGLDVGRDSLSPVSTAYQSKGEYAFTGKIEKVVYELK